MRARTIGSPFVGTRERIGPAQSVVTVDGVRDVPRGKDAGSTDMQAYRCD